MAASCSAIIPDSFSTGEMVGTTGRAAVASAVPPREVAAVRRRVGHTGGNGAQQPSHTEIKPIQKGGSNQIPLPTQHENLKDDRATQETIKKLQEPTYRPTPADLAGHDKKRDNDKTNLQFERDYYATVKYMIVLLSYLVLVAYTLLVLFGPLFLLPIDKAKWCPESESALGNSGADDDDDAIYDEPHYENPDYITDPCFHKRLPELLGLTLEECDLSRRMFASVLSGGLIGYERRVADRPAGIRTMGLVSLGSCFFTISSQLAFKSSTMGWDASRVTAAIPTGVGFLGAGLIWKGTVGVGEEEVHQVHGLTTAASLWLSAAVGAGAGGAMYMVTFYSVTLVILILRYGPQLYLQDDASYNDDDVEEEEWEENGDESHRKEKKARQQSVGLDTSGRSVGKTDEISLEGDESCPSFVSFTVLQHAQGAENDSLRITTPPPYGSTAAAECDTATERQSILRTPGTTESPPGGISGGRNVQIAFGDVSPPPLSLSGRETSEARSVASRSSSAQKRLSHKAGKAQKKKKRSMSKRPTFHS
eukprot:CAMPEP_0181024118 /NCGR_PEP_ID=MMETSP1070-20121207/2402_1 /TAXON_ID=265543 /ORGANISM="Minutocellus polymorphus, Strain NH13" /LENGTH=535 /DNA_ID=CAMNT_0023101155 /DNA_START=145 /DNA_END=1751 /DNA_ORIENTATION=+